MNSLKLSLGPILFFWQKEALLEFYVSMLDTPLDTVYLGEVVCSRRQKMRFSDWFGLAEDLAESGKEIILSSQVLLESESDLKRLRKITGAGKNSKLKPTTWERLNWHANTASRLLPVQA